MTGLCFTRITGPNLTLPGSTATRAHTSARHLHTNTYTHLHRGGRIDKDTGDVIGGNKLGLMWMEMRDSLRAAGMNASPSSSAATITAATAWRKSKDCHEDAGREQRGPRGRKPLTIDTTSAPPREETVDADERELVTKDPRPALESHAAAEQQTRCCTRSAPHALPCRSASRQTRCAPDPPAAGGGRTHSWLPGLPGAFYAPEFVGAELAHRVVAEVRACRDGELSRGITKANGPRLRIWRRSEIDAGGLPAAIAELSRLLREAQVLPAVEELMQVTANQYGDPSSATIVPHKDGRGERAAIVTVLGCATMQFYYQPCCGFVPETQVLDPASCGPGDMYILCVCVCVCVSYIYLSIYPYIDMSRYVCICIHPPGASEAGTSTCVSGTKPQQGW